MELWLEPKIITIKKQRDKLGRFKSGHIPFNKGKKGLSKGGTRTQYKKGHLPHNTKYDGAISIRKHKRDNKSYKYIRIRKGEWVLLHRYLWEKYHGEIPKGCVIRFTDSNSLNCNIDNLECISRAENIERNKDYDKSSETFKKTWRIEKLRKEYGLPLKTKLLNRLKS